MTSSCAFGPYIGLEESHKPVTDILRYDFVICFYGDDQTELKLIHDCDV